MSSEAKVLLLPARTPDIKGRSLFYLFSVRQVAEVLLNTTFQRVPSALPYVRGVAEWCGRALPVLSLERCLGLEIRADRMPLRDVVVRNVTYSDGGQLQEDYAICRVGAAIRHMELPLECEPEKVPDWITDASCLTAVYSMPATVLLVVNPEKIINAIKRKQNLSSPAAAEAGGAAAQPSPIGCSNGTEGYDGLVQG
ncbi:MAG: chemotaxis protein CheW [Desulfobacteraceae bacterium]|jgi:chemotaxis signal transduction protein